MVSQRINFLFYSLLSLFIIVGCTGKEESNRYYSKKGEFSIEFPDGWNKIRASQYIDVTMINLEETVKASVQSIVVDEDFDLADYVDNKLLLLEREGFIFADSGQTLIDGNEAYWFTGSRKGDAVLCYDTAKDNRTYSITFQVEPYVFSEHEDELRSIALSLECKPRE